MVEKTPMRDAWTLDLGAAADGLAVVEDTVVVAAARAVHGLGLADGARRWSTPVPGPVAALAGAGPIAAVVVRGDEGSIVVGIDSAGAILWSHAPGWQVLFAGLRASPDEIALFVNRFGDPVARYVFLATDGRILAEIPAFGDEAPTRADGWLVAAADESAEPGVYRAAADGTGVTAIWPEPAFARAVAEPYLVVNDTVPGRGLAVLEPASGRCLWRVDGGRCSRLAVHRDVVYAVVPRDGGAARLGAWRVADGEEVWTAPVPAAEVYATWADDERVVVYGKGVLGVHDTTTGARLAEASWRSGRLDGGIRVGDLYVDAFRERVVAWSLR